MCSTSAVFDQYRPYIPNPNQTVPGTTGPVPVQPWPQPGIGAAEVRELRELIDSFTKALDAAKTFDRLTNQPDCEDPDKAKLLDRVTELERRLDAIEGDVPVQRRD